jgi:hypothetical protein
MSDNDSIMRGDVFEAIYALHADGKEGIMNAPRNSYGEDLRDVLDAIADIPAVPQEMSAREYLKVRERMASELGELCSACHCEGKCWDCPYHTPDTEDEMKYPDRSVALVEKWAKAHFATDMNVGDKDINVPNKE